MPFDLPPLPGSARFVTAGGIAVERRVEPLDFDGALDPLIDRLDTRRGMIMRSTVEYPGRYRPGGVGFADPPVMVQARGRDFSVIALDARGEVLLPAFARCLSARPEIVLHQVAARRIEGAVPPGPAAFAEEDRTRQPSLFSALRALLGVLATPADGRLGFYGAFGYDLAFQLEPIEQRLDRPDGHRDLVLYLPDTLVVVDGRRGAAHRLCYEFTVDGRSTAGLPPGGEDTPRRLANGGDAGSDHAPGEYPAVVEQARAAFARGELFEVVPGQTFRAPAAAAPGTIFRQLSALNPAPYGALINLGAGEHLVAASPEMYVRVRDGKVETCPISGTVARGRDAVEDAQQIRRLLNSAKDEAELTMCTDVDRNDKARVCEPGSVRLLGRRQIELYSRLIHTVDHVEGTLRAGYDGLDAFLSHAWAVTVTGAPKRRAMQFIEDSERSPRRWYGGAFGALTVDGAVDTGLTLRTIRLVDGRAEVRAGATLLFDSDPLAEDAECRLKASAMLEAVRRAGVAPMPAPMPAPGLAPGLATVAAAPAPVRPGRDRRIVLVDHEDSFVHTLADYFRRTGATVTVLRPRLARAALARGEAMLAVLSPGPGRPADFAVDETIDTAIAAGIPLFGVCLGLQGLVERFGGRLRQLPVPMHGKASMVTVRGGRLMAGLPERFAAGRYHSLVADRASLPACLEVTADTEDGTVMAVEHRTLPLAAVQFHPESLLTLGGSVGQRVVENVVRQALPS